MTILRFAKQLPENKRVQIIIAIRRIIERFQNGETHTSINMPPRVGKSSIIRLAALELNAITKMPTIMTAPWTDNVDQILEAEKIETTYRNYGVDLATPFLTHRVKHLPTNRWWMLTAGMPTLVSCTVGLINNQANRQQFLDGIQDIYQRSNGKRVPVFVDECHLFKDVKAWGIFLREVVDCGGYIVLLTGTAVPGVPGFIEQFTEWEEVRNKTHRKTFVDGEVKHFLDTKEGETRYLESLTADFEMKWQEAWDIGALAKANAVWIDMNVIDENNKEPLGKLSELTTSELNGRLRKVMESQELMKLQIDRGLHRLMQLKSKNNTKNAQMIIVTGSDIDLEDRKESNRHARACEKELKRAAEAIGHVLRIVIATGSIEKAADIIKEFRKGYHDVLIVKFMGLVGLDVPSCKVGIFASPLRNGPLAIQALSRTLTNWVCPATWILPKDRKMVDLYNRVITDQGGDIMKAN